MPVPDPTARPGAPRPGAPTLGPPSPGRGDPPRRTTRPNVPTLEDGTFDLIGVGAGPSNLALAIAVEERAAEPAGVRARFLERSARFGWHRDMLLDDTTMQVSFLKDLVTLRNPTSDFSFLSFLHARARLVDFINHKTLFPLREEFHDYLSWVAARVADQIRYDHEVLAVRPVRSGRGGPDGRGAITELEVLARRGDATAVSARTRNLVLGTGLVPRLPDGVTASNRIWHNAHMLTRLQDLDPVAPGRFVVVGAGQSAAEVTAYLHDRYPDTEVCAVFSRFGYSPADDSPFANRVFDPEAVEEFYAAPADVKRMILDYHGNTNYSVVDLELIQDLYHRAYREKVLGRHRLHCFNVSRVADVVEGPDGLSVDIVSMTTGQKTQLTADAIVFCTGYDPVDPAALLGNLVGHCRRDLDGRYRVQRDYRLETSPELQVGIYLQGGTEHSHGLTSSLLSNIAIRAGEILDSVSRRTRSLVG